MEYRVSYVHESLDGEEIINKERCEKVIFLVDGDADETAIKMLMVDIINGLNKWVESVQITVDWNDNEIWSLHPMSEEWEVYKEFKIEDKQND